MRIETAAVRHIQRLYHYQSFDDPALLEHIITDRAIYCSNPKDFNDPWDCRACFSKSVLDDPPQYERVVRWFTEIGRKRSPFLSDEEHSRRENVLLAERERVEWMIDQMTAGMWQATCAQYRVYCMTPYADVPLMWSHYARSHRGVCLEFTVDNPLFCAALAVEYLNSYPQYNLADDDAHNSVQLLLTKSDDWRYENEYRLVATAPGYRSPGMLETTDNFVTFPNGALTSIVIGCLMPERDREIIRSMLKKTSSPMAMKAAYRVQNQYALEIRQVD